MSSGLLYEASGGAAMGGMSGLAGRTYGSCIKRHPIKGASSYKEVVDADIFCVCVTCYSRHVR